MTEENNDITQQEETGRLRHGSYHHLEPFRDKGPTFALRQWLNVFFLLGGVAGVVLMYTHSRELGIYVFLGAGALKFIELSLRLLKL